MYYNSSLEKVPDINLIYKEIHGIKLPMSVYFPENFDSKKTYPGVIAIHGGAWHAITADSPQWDGGVMKHNAAYYAKKGFVAITYSYRSINNSDETDVKDLICDCNDALCYIKDNFKFIDTRHIILIGDSAGGHLALALSMQLTLEKACVIEPEIIIACNPVTDCTSKKWSFCANSHDVRKSISPMENIKKVDSKILLMHGCDDQCVDINDSRIFFKKMKSVNNDIKITELPNARHAFILFGYRDSDETVSSAHEIIDEYLKSCGFNNL